MNRRNLISNVFIIVFFALFWRASSTLSALDPGKAISQYNVRAWNVENGFPGNTVYAILQTQDGYLWLGIQNGLVRFDGLDFETFAKENTPQLKDNIVQALYEDRDGTLWIGTKFGGVTRYKRGKFSTYSIEDHPPLHRIKAIEEDRLGNLWIAGFGGGLTSLNNGKFTTYTTDDGIPSKQVRAIYKDGNRDLWVTTSAGLVKLPQTGKFKEHYSRDILPHDTVTTVCLYYREKGTENLWIGTGTGLFHLRDKTFAGRYGVTEGIPNQTITYLYRDRSKNLWIGTNGGGLARLSSGVLSTLPAGDELAQGIINSIYEDREGCLWVGTVNRGLFQIRDGKFTNHTTREGLIHNHIYCIHKSRTGDLWIGTRGGLNRLKTGPSTSKVTMLLTTDSGLLDNNISCLFEDAAGRLRIGTWGGLHTFEDGRLSLLTTKNRLSGNKIKCIQDDNRGNTWIGTENGLNRFDNKSGSITQFTTKNGLSSNTVNFVFKDREGNLWIGTDHGLNRLNNGSFTRWDPPPSESGKNSFQCAYQDDEGVLWLGTNNGLIRLNGKETTRYTIACGLVGNDVDSILEDKKGYLWLAGQNGISRVRKKELEDFHRGNTRRIQPEKFDVKDGMKSQWCNGAGCETGDGKFWFPTTVGVTMIDPNNIPEKSSLSAPIIEEFIADGVIIDTHNIVKEKNPLEVTPGKKRLEFHYKTISFLNPQEIEFKIRLTGYDNDWVDMKTNRSTTYTGVPPGVYTFAVKSRHPGGDWDEKGASLSFYLKPYLYQTTWFYVIATLAIVLSVFGGYRLRTRQLKARARELENMVKIRTMELETTHQELRHSKDIIEEKNRNTMASIRYARKIQQTMLPMKEKMETHFKESFVLFLPRDIVSGDFYWFDIVKEHYFIVLADCTGHGVPGALLSMIGYMLLNEMLHGRRLSDPAKILARLHQGFRYVLKQEAEDTDTYDGMDVGLCRIDLKKGKIVYAGARRPLFYVKDGEFFEIKGDRKSIGGRQRERKHVFTNNEIDIPPEEQGGIMFYLTTDGYADQNNPGNEKYGSRRLKTFLKDNAHLKPVQQKRALMKELKDHRLDEEQRDDISIIGIHVP